MRLLALDAALGPCSVSLMDGGLCLGHRVGADSRSATSSLPGLVQALLADYPGGIDAVAVTVGPGSFTGLRGAIALGNGLALGAAAPLVGVTVAEALLAAHPISPDHDTWIALDSRRSGRIFLGRDGSMEAVSLDALPMPQRPVLVLGDAASVVAAALCAAGIDAAVIGDGTVSAEAVGQIALRRLAGEIPPCRVQPLYVEPPEARPPTAMRPALA